MADRLYLSYWIHGFNAMTMPRYYERALRVFPFSNLRRGVSQFRIYAVSYTEPALLEVPVAAPVDPQAVMSSAKSFEGADVCYELDTAWDLWSWDQEWKLAPSAVVLSCLGPEFENETGDNLRIDFGLDEQFLPGTGGAGGDRKS